MSSKGNQSPIEPRLGNLGRAVADPWAFCMLAHVLRDPPLPTFAGALAFLGNLCVDAENVGKVLEVELGDEYVARHNMPKLHEDCSKRLLFFTYELESKGG